jgi:uncharacterized protein YggL (DUF469 family)
MKKRLRKKLGLGEFREVGFEVRFRFSDDLSGEDRNRLLDGFLDRAIVDNGLLFVGGGDSTWEGFVAVESASGSVTEDQRARVEAWLAGEARILESSVGPLTEVDRDRPL